MGAKCTLVLSYNEKLARKQGHSLHNGIEKLKAQIREKWATYKRTPNKVPAGVETLRKESRYKDYIAIDCQQGQPVFSTTTAVEDKNKGFGRDLLFSSDTKAEAGWVITQYHAKHRVEDDFKLLKNPEFIRWRPSRHWTDTKLRAFGFCCVVALVLIRVMELKAAEAGLAMSPAVLKRKLSSFP